MTGAYVSPGARELIEELHDVTANDRAWDIAGRALRNARVSGLRAARNIVKDFEMDNEDVEDAIGQIIDTIDGEINIEEMAR